jgi:hypothetical protein
VRNISSYYSQPTGEGVELNYFFSVDTIERTYSNLDSSIIFYESELIKDTIPFDDTLRAEGLTFIYDTINIIEQCSKAISGIQIDIKFDIDTANRVRKYGNGIGLVYSEDFWNGYVVDADFSAELVYYKKGATTCGTPDNITSIKENSNFEELAQIYPNPVIKQLYIELSESVMDKCSLSIFNSAGVQVYYKANLNKQNEIDFNAYPSGSYLIIIKNGDKKEIERIIKN